MESSAELARVVTPAGRGALDTLSPALLLPNPIEWQVLPRSLRFRRRMPRRGRTSDHARFCTTAYGPSLGSSRRPSACARVGRGIRRPVDRVCRVGGDPAGFCAGAPGRPHRGSASGPFDRAHRAVAVARAGADPGRVTVSRAAHPVRRGPPRHRCQGRPGLARHRAGRWSGELRRSGGRPGCGRHRSRERGGQLDRAGRCPRRTGQGDRRRRHDRHRRIWWSLCRRVRALRGQDRR